MLNFDFLEKGLHHILCMIFQGKSFSCYIPLTDQVSLSDWLYILLEILGNMCITNA